MKYIYSFISLFIAISLSANGDLKQNIRGIVVDKQSQTPLIGVNVIIIGSNPLIGTVTNTTGEFRFENLPIGRQSLQFSYVGYHTNEVKNLMLNSVNEVVLKVEMEEDITMAEEVVIKLNRRKDKPINEMATVSARSFTIEETNRYAGSLGDPAKMAMNYAGVIALNDNRNDIIIRGNSPTGLLWRIDGIEIPNPNHFGALGTTGGAVTILNNNLLTNSDFYTGAWPAEFGNTTSGVFDLKMRNGNNENREHLIQMGYNGLEYTSEGPFSKNSKASYLFSLRYSTVKLMAKLVPFEFQPDFYDVTFKVNVPTKKYGRFSIIGIGGMSEIEMFESDKDTSDWSFSTHGEDLTSGSDLGVIALSHLYFINEKTRINSAISLYGTRVTTKIDTFTREDINPFNTIDDQSIESRLSFSTNLKTKINNKNSFSAGIAFEYYKINYLVQAWIDTAFFHLNDDSGELNFWKGFAQWQHKFNDQFLLYTGVNALLLPYNNSKSINPRVGVKYSFGNNNTLNIGFGHHSQLQPRPVYFVDTYNENTHTYFETNNDLDFSKSIHAVAGYDKLINENFRIKTEAYYQYLYNIPVREVGFPEYSIINSGADFWLPRIDSLVNEGEGRNYGLELTIEKFLSDGYYFLLTSTIYNSLYEGMDGVERNTIFNGNYVFNALGGYEWQLAGNDIITLDGRLTWSGGKRYTPFDIEETRENGVEELDWDYAWELQRNDYFRFDIRVGYHMNKAKYAQSWGIDFQNITNHKNIAIEQINPKKPEEIKTIYQMGFMPMVTYRIHF